jgi:hypothetical protein
MMRNTECYPLDDADHRELPQAPTEKAKVRSPPETAGAGAIPPLLLCAKFWLMHCSKSRRRCYKMRYPRLPARNQLRLIEQRGTLRQLAGTAAACYCRSWLRDGRPSYGALRQDAVARTRTQATR